MKVKKYNETYSTYELELSNGVRIIDKRNENGTITIENNGDNAYEYIYLDEDNGYVISVDLKVILKGSISEQIKYSTLIKEITRTIRDIRKFIDGNKIITSKNEN